MTRGPYFDTRGFILVAFWTSAAEPVEHFGLLSGKRFGKGHKWTSTWSLKLDGFQHSFNILNILCALLQELGADWFLVVFFTVCV